MNESSPIKSPVRKAVWRIFNNSGEVVAEFGYKFKVYAQDDLNRRNANRKKNEQPFYLNMVKITM
jgi:hypothetical protein